MDNDANRAEHRHVIPNTTPYYLPVTREVAQAFVDDGTLPASSIERAALSVMLVVLTQEYSNAAISRLIFETHGLMQANPPEAGAAHLDAGRRAIAQAQRADMLQRLADKGVNFADPEDMQQEAWRDDDGRYAHAFQERYRQPMDRFEIGFDRADQIDEPATDADIPYDMQAADTQAAPRRIRLVMEGTRDQAVAAQVIAAAPDELVNLDAYAGTGKTHLLLAMAGGLAGGMTYLAPTVAHIHGFKIRAGGAAAGIQTVTQTVLANATAAAHARAARLRWAPRVIKTTQSLTAQTKIAGVPSIDGRPPEAVLAIVHKALRAWCYSAAPALGQFHFARHVPYAAIEARRWIEIGQRVWECMFAGLGSNDAGAAFDINTVHLVKWLSVRGAAVPDGFGTLLVDEAHDLSAPWRALLQAYPHGCVLMGDPYQRLFGHVPRATQAKTIVMSQSLRMGVQAAPLIDQTLAVAQERLIEFPLIGAPDRLTRHRIFRNRDELPSRALRVFGGAWALLEEALRIKAAAGRFRLVPASADEVARLARAAISLHLSGDTYGRRSLGDFRSWPAFSQHLTDTGQGSVARMIERGFGSDDIDALMAAQAEPGTEQVTLSLVQHCKNMEADAVVLSPCCYLVNRDGEPHSPVRAAYLAMTRARFEVWTPGDGLDRLKDAQRDFEVGITPSK